MILIRIVINLALENSPTIAYPGLMLHQSHIQIQSLCIKQESKLEFLEKSFLVLTNVSACNLTFIVNEEVDDNPLSVDVTVLTTWQSAARFLQYAYFSFSY